MMVMGIKFPKKEVIIQFSSVAQSCPTVWDPMDCSMLGLPVHHQLPDFTQTHVHWVSDAIQPSHPLLSPSPPTFILSQNQGLFKWVPWTARRSNQSILKEISPEYSLEGLMLIFIGRTDANIHWQDWCWSWNSNTLATWCEELTH